MEQKGMKINVRHGGTKTIDRRPGTAEEKTTVDRKKQTTEDHGQQTAEKKEKK